MQAPHSTHITQTYIHSMFVDMPESLLMKLSESIYEIIDRPGAPKAHKPLTISPNIGCSGPSAVLSAQLHTPACSECRVVAA